MMRQESIMMRHLWRTGATPVSLAKTKHHSFKGQFFKYLSIANPKFGDKFLEEVGFPLMTLLQDFLLQY
jgi:hypothetical protein